MTSFALKTLISDRGKLLIALGGVVFTLVLVNIQGGLFFGLINKASLLIDKCDADIWVGRRGVENVDLPAEIPEAWLHRIRGLPGVVSVKPYIVAAANMSLKNGEFEGVWIVGSDPDTMLGSAWSFAEGNLAALKQPNSIAVDVADDRKLGHPRVGDVVEISGHRAKVAAKTRDSQNFMTTPLVFTTLDSARNYARYQDGYCAYFLVQALEGADLDQLCETIRQRLPDLDVYRADDFSAMSKRYWIQRTGIGVSFGASTLLGLLVGFLMVGQSLYALALDHLGEYATLKAMGAVDTQICWVVILQALSIAAGGAAIGVILIFQMQQVLSSPLAPIDIRPELLLGGIVLVFCICLVAAILPLLRIRCIDPASVLQG